MITTCTCTTLNVDDRPTLLEMEQLIKKDGRPLNLITRIVPEYDEFGRNLLEDPDGHTVTVIKLSNNNPRDVTIAILKKWLARGGATYKYLIECIRKVTTGNLGGLAKDLEESHVSPK